MYGLGGLGSSVKLQLASLTLLFYNQLVGLDAAAVSLALFVALFIDALWDPIVGQISDNTHSRLGRRHPYIYAAAIPAAVCLALLFMPPMSWSDEALFFYLIGVVVAGRMFDSLIDIPNASLLPELSRDYDERTSLASWRYLFLGVGGRALATWLGFGVFLVGAHGEKAGQLNMAGYAPYAVTVAIIGVVAVIASALATQRFVPYMHKPERRQPSFGAMAREIGLAISNRNFVALGASIMIFGITVGISGGLQIYFNTYFWELGSRDLLQLGLWVIPGGLLGVVVAPYWSRLMGKKRGCLIVFFMAIFSTTVPITLRLLGVMPPNSSPWVLRILILDQLAIGLLSTLGFVIVTSMLADVTEEVQLKSGRRSEGVLFAADSLLRKVTQSFAVALPGLILVRIHFPKFAKPGQVDPAILTHLALIYLPVVTVLYLCSTSCILLYRIDRQRHAENLDRIAEAAALAQEGDPEINPHLQPDIITDPA
jgi:Na+/melibiose symporter-like transporter